MIGSNDEDPLSIEHIYIAFKLTLPVWALLLGGGFVCTLKLTESEGSHLNVERELTF
jgi:hypothetical protein